MICVFGPGINAHMESVGLNLVLCILKKKNNSNIHEDSLSFPMLLWETIIFVKIKKPNRSIGCEKLF